MSTEWQQLQPPLCNEVVKTIKQLEFKSMTPVQVRILSQHEFNG